MAILNYTTKIDHWKTIGEIQQALAKRGAQKIIVDNFNELPVGISFSILWHDKPICFAVPCNFKGVLRAMENSKRIAKSQCNEEQALRVGWRIVKDWIEAQLAIVEAEVATMAEVFLPYAVTKDGVTLYKFVESNKSMLALPQ